MYPPVDTTFYHPDGSPPGDAFLIVSALVPYKRIELAMEACRRVGAPLTIVGSGPERETLEAQAGPSVRFLGPRSDDEIRTLYRSARALLLPGEEDFGIVPVEAAACGRPVVGLGIGGVAETVDDGETGVLVEEATPEAFAEGLERVDRIDFDPRHIRERAVRFSHECFHDRMREQLEETVAAPVGTTW